MPISAAASSSAPPASPGHHAELGGLLRHTCEVAAIGRAIAKACRADADLVVAGALLHDIGKLEAYRWDGAFETTERGIAARPRDARHADARPARRWHATAPPCTERELALLHHLIASHHGRLEFGAAVPPMTLEAEVLHFADNASAKTASMADALRRCGQLPGGSLVSARRLWQLDRRRAYRGSERLGSERRGVKKRNGRLVVARRPSHAWTIQGRGIAAAVLLSTCHRLADTPLGRAR